METAPSTLRTGPGPPGGSAIAVEHPRPLVVDLDGTLVATDMLLETLLAVLGRIPPRSSGRSWRCATARRR